MRRTYSTGSFREALRGIDVPAPFSLGEFCESVSARRGRALVIVPVPAVGPCWLGAWVSAKCGDLIYLPASAAGRRRDQIAVHHVCHMLLGHRVRPVSDLAGLFLPSVSPRLAELMLGREDADPDAPYADEEEQAAEEMSSMILARASRCSRPARRPDASPMLVPALPTRCPAGTARW